MRTRHGYYSSMEEIPNPYSYYSLPVLYLSRAGRLQCPFTTDYLGDTYTPTPCTHTTHTLPALYLPVYIDIALRTFCRFFLPASPIPDMFHSCLFLYAFHYCSVVIPLYTIIHGLTCTPTADLLYDILPAIAVCTVHADTHTFDIPSGRDQKLLLHDCYHYRYRVRSTCWFLLLPSIYLF